VQSCPTSPFAPPEANDTTFVVDCGPGLDTFCTFRDGGPLVFNIPVTRHVGDVQKLKANGLISETATLQMPAFDVDYFGGGGFFNPERDRVSFNGNVVPTEFLQGDDGVWRLNEFSVPIEWVNFPADPGPGGSIVPADNTVQIDIDTANSDFVWCTAIDWAALTFKVARPVVMAHGILSSGEAWNKASFSWVNKLNSLGIPNSNRLNMGRLDSIQSNAIKIAGEVANARRRWGVDKVDLVCHSKGGLDARHYVENHDTVERVIQIGTPNSGTRLADVAQGIAIYFGGIPALIFSELAIPAAVQLTRPYMGVYNLTHGPNPKVKYTSLGGDYDPDCFFLNIFCRPVDRLLLLISGKPGDTIVPLSSVHALSYAEHRRFSSRGGNGEAKHTQLNGSLGVYNGVRDRVEIFGTNTMLAEEEPAPSMVRTAAVANTILQGQVQTQTIPIDQATPTFFSMMYPSGNLDMALISPSGQRFDAASVAGRTDVSHDEAEVEGGILEVYNFSAPETGLWTIEISAPSVTEPSGQVGYAVNGWLENPAITFVGSVERPNIHAGETLRLFGTVNNGSAPLSGASVIARVALPDNTLLDVTLHDDGAGGDANANDGVYTGALNNTVQPGTYRIAFNASRTTGPTFSREDFTIATVSRSASTISGPFQDFGLDTDGDGLFNQLVVQAGVNATVAGNYRVLAVLTDSAGNTHTASVLTNLNAGPQTVPLNFDGEAIFNNRVDGPYRLTSVTLSEEGDFDIMPVDQRTDVHQTAAYRFGQFQHAGLSLTGTGSTTGIDNDGNGLFNQLRIGVDVEVINAGFYRWSARLTDRNGTEIGFASGSGSFNSGLNTMNLTFDGETIGRNGVDGPYFVRGLILFGAGDSLVASDAFTTSALRASQFEGFTGSANADLSIAQVASPNPVLTGSNITFTTTVTNNGPGAAESVAVADNLPAGTAFVSCDATGGAICSGAGNARLVTVNSLAAGGSITINLVAAVECSLTDGTAISNTATVTAATPDDNPNNNSATSSVLASNPPPMISNAAADPSVLWPPNHKMIDVTVSYDVTDNCGGVITKLEVASNELVDGDGDGDTSVDWEVLDEHHVRLRAERSGEDNERIYTITITAMDSAGGSSSQTVTVTVPHNQ
jgi:uncharacterized repeat protein (TIGR01451 family)